MLFFSFENTPKKKTLQEKLELCKIFAEIIKIIAEIIAKFL